MTIGQIARAVSSSSSTVYRYVEHHRRSQERQLRPQPRRRTRRHPHRAELAANSALEQTKNRTHPKRNDYAADTASGAANGETTATAYGEAMHASCDYGPGFEREVTRSSGQRVDALNMKTREAIECKPNSPRQIRLGNQPLDGYIAKLNEMYPGTPWAGKVVTYDRP